MSGKVTKKMPVVDESVKYVSVSFLKDNLKFFSTCAIFSKLL